MRRSLVFFIVSFLALKLAFARIYIDVTKPASSRIGVALKVSGYPLPEFERVLKSDLTVYGIFAVYPLSRFSLSLEELRLIGADLLLDVDVSALGNRAKVAFSIKDITDGTQVDSGILDVSVMDQVGAAHTVANRLYRVVTGNNGMFGRYAVAFRKVIGGYELVLVDVGALRYKVLAFFKEPAQSPSLSPDGRLIAFSKMNSSHNFDIYIYDLANGTYRPVCRTPCPDTAPQWMPDGRHLVFSGCVKPNNPDILVCDVETGKVVKRLTRSIAIDTSPAVSPDGKRIAFVSNREGAPHIYVKDLETGEVYRITRGRYDVSPDWSPKGDSIAFSSTMEMGTMVGVYYLGSGSVRYLFSGEDPAWSPNGDYLLYTRGSGLYISSAYGSGEMRLFVGKWINPSWR